MKDGIKWGSATIAILLIFCWLMPVNIYSSALYLLVIIGSLSFTFTAMKTLDAFLYKEDRLKLAGDEISEEERASLEARSEETSGCLIAFAVMFLLFGSATAMVGCEMNMETSELRDYGKLTTAKVLFGSSYASRRYDFSNIVLGYLPEGGDSVYVKHSISQSQFGNFYKNQSLPIIYSSRYPSILKVIYTQEELEKYLKR